MQMKMRKSGLILMSLLLVFTSLPVSASEEDADQSADVQNTTIPVEEELIKEPENQRTDADILNGDDEKEVTDSIEDSEEVPETSAADKETVQNKDDKAEKEIDIKEAEPDAEEAVEYNLSSDKIEVRFKDNQAEYEYTGAEVKPEIEVVATAEYFSDSEGPKSTEGALDEKESVIDASHYTIEYQNNIEAGEAAIVLTGKDEPKKEQGSPAEEGKKQEICTGIKTVKFTIVPVDINKCTLQAPKTADYTGKQVKPKVTLTYQEKQLVSGKDYKLTYSNNKKIGTAAIKIDGAGNFKGTKTIEFKIRFGTPVVKTSSDYSKIKLKWQKVKDAAGYVVYRSSSQNGKFKKVKTYKSGSSTSYTDKKVKFGKTYHYKVRAYKKVKVKVKKKTKTKQEYGSYSAIASVKTKLSAVSIKSAKCASETTAKVSWKSVSGAQGYEIYKSEAKDGAYTYAGKVSGGGKVSYTAKKLKTGVTYYFKVKAYRKSGLKKYYGAFSATKKETFTDGQRLYSLFPNGVPTKKAEMERYLVTITVPIKDADGVPSTMQLRVHKNLTKNFMKAFQDMYAAGFPVRAEDTDTYNWRSMASGRNRSHHSYGCVVDLNWNSNPMIGVTEGEYKPGVDPYSVTTEVVAIWKKHGFYWGGAWKSSKDYMHFTYTNH